MHAKIGTSTADRVDALGPLLQRALEARTHLMDPAHRTALRLFAGFHEGEPDLVADLYADTLLLHNYAEPPEAGAALVGAAADFYTRAMPWIATVATKPRRAPDPAQRRGEIMSGGPPAREVREDGVRYSIDVLGMRDAGFFLDTRNLRAWARSNLAGKTVLNTFAYTGSLGVAAMAGAAARVVHLDVRRDVLNVAKTSYTLNGFPIRRADFVTGDFWVMTSRWRRSGELFDCIILDPPFFATSSTGTIDLQNEVDRLINKVRPLVADRGHLIVVNNALFHPGAAFMETLLRAGADGYTSLKERIAVPDDITGFPETLARSPTVDPAPFNHATKIAVLAVRRREGPAGTGPPPP
jgi:23S rRNA (cytosine1962-C5)-methyltransferase